MSCRSRLALFPPHQTALAGPGLVRLAVAVLAAAAASAGAAPTEEPTSSAVSEERTDTPGAGLDPASAPSEAPAQAHPPDAAPETTDSETSVEMPPSGGGGRDTKKPRNPQAYDWDKPTKRNKIPVVEPAPEVSEAFFVKVEILQSDPNPGKRARAAHALVKLDKEASLSYLVLALNDPHPVVVVHSIRALHKTQNPRAIVPILRLANHPHPQVRAAVNSVIQRESVTYEPPS